MVRGSGSFSNSTATVLDNKWVAIADGNAITTKDQVLPCSSVPLITEISECRNYQGLVLSADLPFDGPEHFRERNDRL